jgi:hypothetical protein
VEVAVERKWTQRNVTIAAGVVVLAMALLAAVVVTAVLTRPDHSGETADTVMDTGYTTLPTVPATNPPAFPASMPADFRLTAEWGVARMNTLDTLDGTFTKDLVTGAPPTATTSLVLTAAELQRLFDGLRDLDPWSYPNYFHPWYADVTSAGIDQMVTPAMKYHLRVVAAGVEKEIWWADDNGSSVAAAEALREWFRLVWTTVESKPEYKAMPRLGEGTRETDPDAQERPVRVARPSCRHRSGRCAGDALLRRSEDRRHLGCALGRRGRPRPPRLRAHHSAPP